MESKSKMLDKALKGCGEFVNHQRSLRSRPALKGAALRKQSTKVWNALMFKINVRRLNSGQGAIVFYA